MADAIIVAVVGASASVVSGVISFFAGTRRTGADTHVAQIGAKGALEDRLLDRIDKLEARLDAQHEECRREITDAVAKAERECEERMAIREIRIRHDVTLELERRLAEIDERNDVD